MPSRRRNGIIAVLILVTGAAVAIYFLNPRASQEDAEITRRPGALFKDIAQEAGLDFEMKFLPSEQGETFKINLYDHGCGLAVGDYDGDGHEDVYFLNQLGPNAMFRNKGDGTFEDVTAQVNLTMDRRVCVGATFADYDNDGDQDLYVTSTRGGNVLFRNDSGRRFTDVTDEAGVRNVGHSQSAIFFDYNRDGLLDLYVAQTSKWTTDRYDQEARYYPGRSGIIKSPKEQNILYRNQGNGSFVDATESAGLAGRGWSADMAVFDYDEDGWLDVLVVCMFGRSQLYRNQHDGSFRDVTAEVLGKTPWGGTGAKVLDFNNDGKLDICIVDMHSDMWMGLDYSNSYFDAATASEKVKFEYSFGPNTGDLDKLLKFEAEQQDFLDYKQDEVFFGNAFFEARGDGKFVEVSGATNTETFWPWGIATGDYDNDGHVDMFVTAGMGYPFYYWHNYLLMNNGEEVFDDRSFALGTEPPVGGNYLPEMVNGKKCSKSSRCAVSADFDGDGRLEILVNNFNSGPYYFKNQSRANNHLTLRLHGVQSNRDAIGALVRIHDGEETLTRQVQSAGGYLSCPSKTLHFGLGQRTSAKRVEIIWPSGVTQVLENLSANQLHHVTEPTSAARRSADVQAVLTRVTGNSAS